MASPRGAGGGRFPGEMRPGLEAEAGGTVSGTEGAW